MGHSAHLILLLITSQCLLCTLYNSIMKSVILLALVAMSAAAPQRLHRSRDEFGNSIEYIPIIAETRSEPEGGSYAFTFESADGTIRSESGAPGANGATEQEGEWTLTFPDGQAGTIRFIADAGGARFESPSLLPIAPEMPEHALEQIRLAEEERARGVVHDGQWDAS